MNAFALAECTLNFGLTTRPLYGGWVQGQYGCHDEDNNPCFCQYRTLVVHHLANRYSKCDIRAPTNQAIKCYGNICEVTSVMSLRFQTIPPLPRSSAFWPPKCEFEFRRAVRVMDKQTTLQATYLPYILYVIGLWNAKWQLSLWSSQEVRMLRSVMKRRRFQSIPPCVKYTQNEGRF